MTEYKIIKDTCIMDLESAINEAAEDGWKLKGHLTPFEGYLVALLYKN